MDNMRTVRIGAMTRENFEKICEELYKTIPERIVNSSYLTENDHAVFTFEDSAYIHACMLTYATPKIPDDELRFLNDAIKPFMWYKLGNEMVGPK